MSYYQLTETQSEILAAVYELPQGKRTERRIASAVGLSNAAVGYQIERLIRMGYLRRPEEDIRPRGLLFPTFKPTGVFRCFEEGTYMAGSFMHAPMVHVVITKKRKETENL